MAQPSRRQVLMSGLAGLGAIALGTTNATAASVESFYFHHDHIIGTSLDLWLDAPGATHAERAEHAVLAEVERLRAIFSTYDATSELSQLNRTREAHAASADMLAVLRAYETWHVASNGVCNAQLEAFVQTWREAERTQTRPTPSTLAGLLQQAQSQPWRIDGHTVTRLTALPLNLNAVAKGYIIERATEAAKHAVPELTNIVLNIGGDLRTIGRAIIAVQDPHQPADFTKPLSLLRVGSQATATSGGYQRYYTIDGVRHSHLLEPRTGRSATALASATVIAPESMTANVLATTIAVGTADEALRLVAQTPGCECLLVRADGSQVRSPGFAAYELDTNDTPDDTPKKDEKKDDKKAAWPADYQVFASIELPAAMGGRYKKPYVAVWFEDADGKPVRTVTVWGNSPRWIRDLSVWWKFAKDDAALVKAVSRATRAPGKYEVVWDGKDDKGNAVPQGTYTIKVEVHREHGKHLTQSGQVKCSGEDSKITLEKNAETGDTLVEFRKKK